MSYFFTIGTSHRHASVELRERIAFAEEELTEVLNDLVNDGPCREAVILSTCNRTELTLLPSTPDFTPERALAWLAERRNIVIDDDHFFHLEEISAARHLMEVASGIDSQVVGDIQIIGQVKNAYLKARESGTLGPVLTRLFETALRTGKRVKTETEIFTGAVSISYVAVELARKIFYPLDEQRALVIGAGETGELTAISLYGRGVREIAIANRTAERGAELIERLGFGTPLPWEELGDRLQEYDIVIVATGARDYILDYEMVARAAAERSRRQMLIVDLAIPRNVDPQTSEIPNVFCKDLNDLNSVIAGNVERRREDVPKAEEIINEELKEFTNWHRMAPVRPVIAELRRRASGIAEEMLRQNRRRFDDDTFQNVEKLVDSVVRKILALPMSRLLDPDEDAATALRRAAHVRELFGLEEEQKQREEGKKGEG